MRKNWIVAGLFLAALLSIAVAQGDEPCENCSKGLADMKAELKVELKKELKAELLAELREELGLPAKDCPKKKGECKGDCGGSCKGKGMGKGMGECKGDGSCGGSCKTVKGLDGLEGLKGKAPKAYLESLQKALERELYARDFYEAVAKKFSQPRRYSNIARSEQVHADAIVAVIKAFGAEPVLKHDVKVVVPATVAEADAKGLEIEKAVIAHYKKLIKDCPDKKLLPVLKSIQEANGRHLSAFGGS